MGEAELIERLTELDRELVSVAKEVKLLSCLTWPQEVGERFLEQHRKGRLELPEIHDRCFIIDNARIEALRRLSEPIADHPLARFVAKTAYSYLRAARMLAHVGEPHFSELSIELYGAPKDRATEGGLTNLEAAEHFIDASDEIADACGEPDPDPDGDLSPEEAADVMRTRFGKFFGPDSPSVEVDPHLASKAAAGATRVRLRGGTRFGWNELELLIEHEGYVHTATALNGRKQPFLTCMSLGSPRTTTTQEGIATFAEFITCRMDLVRLRRLALRVKAIQQALDGADFVTVFRFFLGSGQSPFESFQSAQRVFRGGHVEGGIAFTKDAVYLKGLLTVHGFLLSAMRERKVHLTQHLFAGRLTCRDAIELEPWFAAGLLAPPAFVPGWIRRRENLAANLTFSLLAHAYGVDLDREVRLCDIDE